MSLAVTFFQFELVLQQGLKLDSQATDVATAQRMQQREEHLRQEMTRLLQEEEQSRRAQEAMFLHMLQQWPFWAIVGALIPLAWVCWLARKTKLASGSKQDSSSSEKEKDLNGVDDVVRHWAVSTPLAMQDLPATCKVLKELVGELLGVCRALCKCSFMPQMDPAVGKGGTYEAWSVHENSITYHVLMFLRPPLGHSFSLELDTTGQLPARHIRVVPECICLREQLLGGISCFLHHPEDKQWNQSLHFLHTLCTGSYLDMEKIASWVQPLVASAWLLLPQSCHCQLTMLPSSKSCKFQLSSSSKMNIVTELTFAVE